MSVQDCQAAGQTNWSCHSWALAWDHTGEGVEKVDQVCDLGFNRSTRKGVATC